MSRLSPRPSSSPRPSATGGKLSLLFGYFSPSNQNGTVKAFAGFNANADAEALQKAMKGLGCRTKDVMNILCRRSNSQRQQIIPVFKALYGKDLIKELISELSGKFEEVILGLMETPADYDAKELKRSMKGIGTKESVLIEILCSRTNAEIFAAKASYKRLFGTDLQADVCGELSGALKNLMVSLMTCTRDESNRIDKPKAATDAAKLYAAGQKKLGTDEDTFNAILSQQNFTQLQMVFQEYQKLSGNDLELAVSQEFSGDAKTAFTAIVKVTKNRPAFFAEQLYLSMKGLGTRDSDLIRICVSRCEKDMIQIIDEYPKRYQKRLDLAISSECSGVYKDALLVLTTKA